MSGGWCFCLHDGLIFHAALLYTLLTLIRWSIILAGVLSVIKIMIGLFLFFSHICCVSSFYTNKNLWSGMSRLETSSQLTCFPNIECFLEEKIRTLDLWGLLEMSFRWRNKRLFNRLLNLMLYKVSCINFNLWLKILLLHIPLEKSWKLFSNILRKRCVWNTQNNGSIKSFQTRILFQHFFFSLVEPLGSIYIVVSKNPITVCLML